MHSNFELGNIKRNTIQEIINGPKHLDLKNTMANQQWHQGCRSCREFELTTNSSPRTMRKISTDILENIDKDVNYFKLEHLTVNWSNLCNLTCTYCNAETSTAWQQIKKIPIKHVKNNHQSLIELAKEQGKNIVGITLGGGEPLLHKGLCEFLQHLDPENVSVLVTTNLSVDLANNPVYQLLKTWKTVNWQISFDNANKEKFEYVRRGASWTTFVNNIHVMNNDGQDISAHPAYSVYCAFELVDYYKFCKENNLRIFWCDLVDPWDLDVRRYSDKLRRQAIEQIDLVEEMYYMPEFDKYTVNTLKRYRVQLIDNSYLVIPGYKADPVKFHAKFDQKYPGQYAFSELWAEVVDHFLEK